MRKIDINELKRIEINILDYVADFCNKNGITYYLDGCTFVGCNSATKDLYHGMMI